MEKCDQTPVRRIIKENVSIPARFATTGNFLPPFTQQRLIKNSQIENFPTALVIWLTNLRPGN